MTGATLGIPLALTWLVVVNVVATVVVSLVAAALAARRRPLERPGLPLALRLLPGLGAVVFVVAVFAPAHARFEPVETTETLSVSLAVLATVGLFAIARATRRVWRALRQTHETRRRWMRGARPLAAACGAVPCFEVEDADATVSLVGLLRPVVFVSTNVVSALSDEELAVALAHERAHARAFDNLKRLLLAACPDAVPFRRSAAWLEREWHAATECVADARAVAGQPLDAVRLASALLAVARVAPSPTPAAAWSRIHDRDLLEMRVRRLLADDAPEESRRWWLWRAGVATLVTAVAACPVDAVLMAVHRASELAVRLLP